MTKSEAKKKAKRAMSDAMEACCLKFEIQRCNREDRGAKFKELERCFLTYLLLA
jgi:hypothetical protein